MPDKKYYTWKQIHKMSTHLAKLVEPKFFTHIIGISRGGCIPATIISHKLDIPMIPISLSTRDHAKEMVPDFPVGHGTGDNWIDHYRFLVVDDTALELRISVPPPSVRDTLSRLASVVQTPALPLATATAICFYLHSKTLMDRTCCLCEVKAGRRSRNGATTPSPTRANIAYLGAFLSTAMPAGYGFK